MTYQGRHSKQDDSLWYKILAYLAALLIVVQLLMLNDGVRRQLSIVDQLEGERIGSSVGDRLY